MERSSGILLPITALPSPGGIGTLGAEAYRFADFLQAAGQKYWQILPVGPTGYGDSPYSAFSTFAGSPYLIDPALLAQDGLLTAGEAAEAARGGDIRRVDYGWLYETRLALLRRAKERGWARDAAAVAQFQEAERRWLPDYALFMALKRHFRMKPWLLWDDAAIRLRRSPGVLARYRALLFEDVEFFTYIQFLFYRQWEQLRAYLRGKGIRLIGDVPIYVALDSADVWAEPENFQLDEAGVPLAVAGVPPDRFSADGQLWGNPLYDWEHMKEDGYGWWIRRFGGAARWYDVVRIDHFRGLESYWSVPYGEGTARNGRWVKGPGMAFLRPLLDWFSGTEVIAEDLGVLTAEVRTLLRASALPGMKVLLFAFSPDGGSEYLPHCYERGCVCYTGTHDNETVMQWWAEADEAERAFARAYLGLNEAEGINWGVIRGGMSSAAQLFICPMQDYLGLGAQGRINRPGTAEGNWQWRLQLGEASRALAEKILACTWRYGR